MAKTKANQKKGKAKASAPAEEVTEVEVIELQEQLERGGYVPAIITNVSEETIHKARELVAAWQLHGSQAHARMKCLIEMETKKNLMQPLNVNTMKYMGQVDARCAASLRLRAVFLVEWCG